MVQVKDLAQLILEKTTEGKLEWTTLSGNLYQVAIGDNIITVDAEQRVYTLSVRNSDGQLIDRMNAPFSSGTEDEKLLRELYITARRQALRVDVTLEDIMNNLNNL